MFLRSTNCRDLNLVNVIVSKQQTKPECVKRNVKIIKTILVVVLVARETTYAI